MPTYEYTCTACGHRLEAVQKFSDAPLTVCPDCGGELRKVYGAVGIVLKGSGFYKTDSRAAGNGKSVSKESSSSSSDSSSSESSSPKADSTASTSSTDSGSKSEAKPAASTTS